MGFRIAASQLTMARGEPSSLHCATCSFQSDKCVLYGQRKREEEYDFCDMLLTVFAYGQHNTNIVPRDKGSPMRARAVLPTSLRLASCIARTLQGTHRAALLPILTERTSDEPCCATSTVSTSLELLGVTSPLLTKMDGKRNTDCHLFSNRANNYSTSTRTVSV